MKAVKPGYTPRTLDQLGEQALKIMQAAGRPLSAGQIGEKLFRDECEFFRGTSPFARLAGRALKRLQKAGRAKWVSDRDGWMGWISTDSQRRSRR